MKKRIIVLFLACMLVFTLTGCSYGTIQKATTDEVIEQDDSSVKIYKTSEVESYLSFLETFNEKEYQILGISTCPVGRGTYKSYIVTYQKLEVPREEVKKIEAVHLFQTGSEEEQKNFLSNLDNNQYEILDISTTKWGTEDYFYMVTYRELREQ